MIFKIGELVKEEDGYEVVVTTKEEGEKGKFYDITIGRFKENNFGKIEEIINICKELADKEHPGLYINIEGFNKWFLDKYKWTTDQYGCLMPFYKYSLYYYGEGKKYSVDIIDDVE